MKLKKEFVDTILNCQWLYRCGRVDNFEFDVQYLISKSDVEKNINGIKWENLCIDRRGDFTTYLFKNHKLEYNKNWNDEVREIKEKYIPMISEKVSIALTNNGMVSNILNGINMNLLSIFMLEYFSEYYSCDFYNKMLEIYLAGHLPCGWAGEYPNGKFVVY